MSFHRPRGLPIEGSLEPSPSEVSRIVGIQEADDDRRVEQAGVLLTPGA
jgi:hypothetical protein